jgi:hypothetical protein
MRKENTNSFIFMSYKKVELSLLNDGSINFESSTVLRGGDTEMNVRTFLSSDLLGNAPE